MVNKYTRDDERLPSELRRIQRSLADSQRATGTERDRTMMRMQDTINALAAQQALLADAAKIYTASTGATHTSASWMPNQPAVQAASLSRRFRVTVTGGSAGGSTILTFSTTGYSRDRALGSSASAILARAMALGGMSDAGTAQRTWVITMPTTGTYTFTAEARPTDGYASAIGLQIDVQPVL